jgi:hypothetical protein
MYAAVPVPRRIQTCDPSDAVMSVGIPAWPALIPIRRRPCTTCVRLAVVSVLWIVRDDPCRITKGTDRMLPGLKYASEVSLQSPTPRPESLRRRGRTDADSLAAAFSPPTLCAMAVNPPYLPTSSLAPEVSEKITAELDVPSVIRWSSAVVDRQYRVREAAPHGDRLVLSETRYHGHV